ncbi:hypothetical protein MSAN_00211500 [Mycena sanguinolenta]|uniref:Uncharacterized protein n=1 Tax=Mycena sanguinolenta TaxID=230812 RepID=A0A8H6ZHY6_9AGAR|nr:hypothetical protein MSAN_00211500 [Mycena sanguinolenta]
MQSPAADLAKWPGRLLPLAALFGQDTDEAYKVSNPATCFTDEFGNTINFGHTGPSWLMPYVLPLLKNGKSSAVEVQELDKGRLFYTLQKHEETGYWVFSHTKFNLYGWIGIFTSSVVVKELDGLIQFVEKLDQEK